MCRLLHQKLFICKEGKNNYKSRPLSPNKGERIFFSQSVRTFPQTRTQDNYTNTKKILLDIPKNRLLCFIWNYSTELVWFSSLILHLFHQRKSDRADCFKKCIVNFISNTLIFQGKWGNTDPLI